MDEDQDGREGGRFDTGRPSSPVPRETPGLSPSDRPTDWDRRERVGFALYMVGMLVCQFSRLRGDSAPWSEVLGLGIIVAAQYSLLLRPFSERTLRLLAAGTIALLFARARATGAESVMVVLCPSDALCGIGPGDPTGLSPDSATGQAAVVLADVPGAPCVRHAESRDVT